MHYFHRKCDHEPLHELTRGLSALLRQRPQRLAQQNRHLRCCHICQQVLIAFDHNTSNSNTFLPGDQAACPQTSIDIDMKAAFNIKTLYSVLQIYLVKGSFRNS